MLDHVSLRVSDFPRAIAFYKAALAPIGYDIRMEFPDVAGIGEPGKPDLWVMRSDQPINPTHLSFRADRSSVDAFHAAALAAGGTDNGPPGLRLDYHPHYYAAFVLDPEGNNIEVVCHDPPGAPRKMAARASAAKKKSAAKSKKAPKPKAKASAKSPKSAKSAKGKKRK
jgi:catechol 2,3-dioxygenase-like lactoylglutathione lyase family enzyme